MSRLSMDLKVMPRLQKGHCYIMCIIDEMTNYFVTDPLYQVRLRRHRRSPNKKCNKQVWYPRVHDNGPRQHIYVHIDELHIQEVGC